MKFEFKDSRGIVICFVELVHLWADVYGLIKKVEQEIVEPEIWTGLINQAKSAAAVKGARTLCFRLIQDNSSEQLAQRLPALGFAKKQDRIEFRKLLADLPLEAGSPIQWRRASDMSFGDVDVARLLTQVAEGDPDSDPTDDPLVYIQDWMKDPVLTSGTDCIGVGMIDGEVCALVVAQINPKTKWSRISYMGVAPKYRGRGLGVWVHRHGFEMLRKQGGELYHGGTSAENHSMLKLFERNGCDFYRKMEEWALSFESLGG